MRSIDPLGPPRRLLAALADPRLAMGRGILDALVTIAVLGGSFFGVANWLRLGNPSAELFRHLAQVGTGFLVAYSIALASAQLASDVREESEGWVGFCCGIGIAGLIAIGFSLVSAAYRETEHEGIVATIGLCWTAAALSMLGLFVAILPFLVFSWRKQALDEG